MTTTVCYIELTETERAELLAMARSRSLPAALTLRESSRAVALQRVLSGLKARYCDSPLDVPNHRVRACSQVDFYTKL